jgi:MtN3 and saliva related transmembrane protein
MDPEPVLAVAASTGGVLMGLAPLLQLRRMRVRGHSDDVSIPFLLVIAGGAAVWLAYGFAIPNAALIIPNIVAVVTNIITALTAARLRSRSSGPRPPATGTPRSSAQWS